MSQEKRNPRNPVSKQLGDVIGVKRYKKWLENGKPSSKLSIYIDKEQLGPYASFVPLKQFYNGEQILYNAKRALSCCVRHNYTKRDVEEIINILDKQLRVTVQVQVENPMKRG